MFSVEVELGDDDGDVLGFEYAHSLSHTVHNNVVVRFLPHFILELLLLKIDQVACIRPPPTCFRLFQKASDFIFLAWMQIKA